MSLKQISNITVSISAKKPEPKQTSTPLYTVENKCDIAYFYLLPHPDQLEKYAELPNLVHSFTYLDKETGRHLRKALGNKVIILTDADDEVDFDLCDALLAQNFQLFIRNNEPENRYKNFIIKHFTTNVPEEEKIDQLNELCLRISWYQNALERDAIIKEVAKSTKVKTATLLKQVNDYKEVREEDVQELEPEEKALPKWVDKDRYYTLGFDWREDGEQNTGFYFAADGGPRQLTNFILTPLIHVYTQDDDNRRLTEVNNGYHKTVIQLPSKAFTSLEMFETIITNEGAFWTMDGFTKSHLNRLKSTFLREYPKCYELKTLGWQPEGFFSYSNMIYKDELIEFNSYGVAEVGEINYLSMGASNILDGVRAEDDIFKNDKYLRYNETDLTFKQWCQLMVKVYPDHGQMGISWCFLAAFKDVVFKRNNNCPIPYAYGAVQAGKSKFVESVCNLFTHDMPMFNLNQGTDYAFFERMERFRNVPVGFNEFDENTIKEEWFRAMKGAFDGEGRAKGSGRRNKTRTQDINCLPILLGQYLSSKDDNSVLMRSLPCKFTEGKYGPAQIAAYNELKAHEKRGISNLLCEILAHRSYVAENYNLRFEQINAQLKLDFTRENLTPKTRVLENYTAALTMFKLLAEVMDTGLHYSAFYTYCKNEISKMSTILTESNSLSEFWKVVEFLLDQEQIEQGFHYKIEVKTEVKLSTDRKTTQDKIFKEPKKLMFLRMNTIHALYLQIKRQQTGKPGLNEQTILTYLRDQEYFIGSNPSSKFKSSNGNVIPTSSYILDYDMIGINLERFKEDSGSETTITGKIYRDAEIIDVLGKQKLSFRLVTDASYEHEGHQVKKEIFTNCLFNDLRDVYLYKQNREVEVTGNLNERRVNGYRDMQITDVKFWEAFIPTVTPTEEANNIFGKSTQPPSTNH